MVWFGIGLMPIRIRISMLDSILKFQKKIYRYFIIFFICLEWIPIRIRQNDPPDPIRICNTGFIYFSPNSVVDYYFLQNNLVQIISWYL
jgi:hypothetical protein